MTSFRNHREAVIWAAGLFEGEGSVALIRPKKQVRPRWALSLEMTDEATVRLFASIFGLGIRVYARRPRGPLAKLPRWSWRIDRKAHVYYVLAQLYPFLQERRRARAREALLALPPVHLLGRAAALGRPGLLRTAGGRVVEGRDGTGAAQLAAYLRAARRLAA